MRTDRKDPQRTGPAIRVTIRRRSKRNLLRVAVDDVMSVPIVVATVATKSADRFHPSIVVRVAPRDLDQRLDDGIGDVRGWLLHRRRGELGEDAGTGTDMRTR